MHPPWMQLWDQLAVNGLHSHGHSDLHVLALLTSCCSAQHCLEIERTCTAGEYLKTKRSLIRANEKLASMSEKVEQLKQALHKAGLNNGADSPSARSDTSTQPFGTPKSVQPGTSKSHT